MSELFGIPSLGYQNESNYGEFVLGDEFELIDGEVDGESGAVVRQSERRVRVRLVKNTSGGVIKPGTVVKRDATGDLAHDVAPAGDGEIGCGIADPRISGDIKDDAKFLIITKGPIDCVASAACTKGHSANVAANGEVEDGLNTAIDAFGVILEAASAQGDIIRVDVDFRAIGL